MPFSITAHTPLSGCKRHDCSSQLDPGNKYCSWWDYEGYFLAIYDEKFSSRNTV